MLGGGDSAQAGDNDDNAVAEANKLLTVDFVKK